MSLLSIPRRMRMKRNAGRRLMCQNWTVQTKLPAWYTWLFFYVFEQFLFVCLPFCLSVYHCVHVYFPVCLYVFLCLCVCLSICPPVCLSASIVCLSTYLFVCLFGSTSICLAICLLAFLSVHSTCLPLSFILAGIFLDNT